MFNRMRKFCLIGIFALLLALLLDADPALSAISYASSSKFSGVEIGKTLSTASEQSKIIVVSISQQELYAYDNGQLFVSTPVATGQPALPTPTGIYHVFGKYSPYTFISPWPVGSPYYYATATANYALEWAQGGYFLHDAPWRGYFGKGANNWHKDPLMGEDPGTHGCINVPTAVMAQIYNWATIGTTLQINA
jgi:lipoprotein-anchoring transpeptidase ErfK/SrfK